VIIKQQPKKAPEAVEVLEELKGSLEQRVEQIN
jgi:hypothetical protein